MEWVKGEQWALEYTSKVVSGVHRSALPAIAQPLRLAVVHAHAPIVPPSPRPPFACCTAARCCTYCSGVSGARAWLFNTWASYLLDQSYKACYCFGATGWTRSPDQPGYVMGLINVSH